MHSGEKPPTGSDLADSDVLDDPQDRITKFSLRINTALTLHHND